MTDCKINKYSSRVCSLGTKSCVMKHEGIAERNAEITQLRQELEISRQNYREVVTANAGLSDRMAELEGKYKERGELMKAMHQMLIKSGYRFDNCFDPEGEPL